MRESFYDVLGVEQEDPYDAIKAAFSKKARQLHPDKNGGLESNDFKAVQEAWETLRDPDKRQSYNHQLIQDSLHQKAKSGRRIPLLWTDLEAARDDETNQVIHVYDCRCGEELILEDNYELSKSTRHPPSHFLLDCPGCCFVYEIKDEKPREI